MENTDKATALRKKNVVVSGEVTSHTMGIRLPNSQRDAYIIGNPEKEFPGRKGWSSQALINKSKETPGESPDRSQSPINLTDEEEGTFSNLVVEAKNNPPNSKDVSFKALYKYKYL